MILQDATPADVDAVLAATHPIWGEGLDERSYKEYVATLMSTEWGRAGGFRFLVLRALPGGPILAAMKLYRLAARLAGQSIQVGGVGAVFTMPEARRQGHAAVMLEQAHGMMRKRGDALVLLFSEIGAAYYAGLGYQELPARAVARRVPEGARDPEGIARMRKSEIPDIARLRAAADADQPFALQRDAACWRYLMARHTMPTLWLGRQHRESLVLTRGGRGYLWALFVEDAAGPRARILDEAEVAPGAALPALHQALHAECARRGVSTVEAWDGTGVPMPHAAVPMWRVLDDSFAGAAREAAPAARFHLADVF